MSKLCMAASGGSSSTALQLAGERLGRRLPFWGEEGQSLVEFAVTLPVLLLVVTGLMTFGVAINNYLLLTDGVNIGARQLAISRGQTTDPCSTVSSAVIAAAPLLKPANMTFRFVFNGSAYTGTSCNSSSPTTGAAGQLVQGATATVTVLYPCGLKIYNSNNFPTCNMTAQTSELVQ